MKHRDGSLNFALVPQGGTVVNADRQFRSDVLIVGGSIAQVGENLQVTAAVLTRPLTCPHHPIRPFLTNVIHVQAPVGARVLDATGNLVMPGGLLGILVV